MLEIVDFLAKIAALAAAYVAFRGLYTWRRDFIGRRQLELAEDALVLFYKSRDAIAAIRSPMSWVGEGGEIERHDGESDFAFHSRTTVAPTFKRNEEYAPVFSDLEAMKYRYMARFGEAAAKPFDDLVHLRVRILVKARQYVTSYSVNFGERDDARARKQIERRLEAESYFWSADKDGPVEIEIARIMKVIEEHARGVMMATVVDTDPALRWFAAKADVLIGVLDGSGHANDASKDAASSFDTRGK